MAKRLTTQQFREIAARSMAALATVEKAYADPNSVREASYERVRRAAEELKLPAPPKRKEG